MDEIYGLITRKETGIDRELFKNYFGFQILTAMLKSLHKLDNTEKKNS